MALDVLVYSGCQFWDYKKNMAGLVMNLFGVTLPISVDLLTLVCWAWVNEAEDFERCHSD